MIIDLKKNSMKNIIKKTVFLLFCFFIAISANAVDESIFAERYPNIDEYQSISLQGLKNYFSTFLSKSVVIKGADNSYLLVYQDNGGAILSNINARIERKRSENSLHETVHFILPNSLRFDFTLVRHGSDLQEISDINLLSLKLNIKEDSYELFFNQLEARFQTQQINKDLEKSYIYLRMFDINVLIETNLKDKEATRNYIVFYKDMPNPHSMLSVRAITDSGENHFQKYIHSAKGMEISPKYFFQGLNEFAGIYVGFAQTSLAFLTQIGFPRIQGIN